MQAGLCGLERGVSDHIAPECQHGAILLEYPDDQRVPEGVEVTLSACHQHQKIQEVVHDVRYPDRTQYSGNPPANAKDSAWGEEERVLRRFTHFRNSC